MLDIRFAARSIQQRRHATAVAGSDDRQACGSSLLVCLLHDWLDSGPAFPRASLSCPAVALVLASFSQDSCGLRPLMRHVTHCSRNGRMSGISVSTNQEGSKRSEESLPVRANLAPQPCIRLDPLGGRTMKQLCASAEGLRGGGPILTDGSVTVFWPGSPPPRIVFSIPSCKSGGR